MWEEEIQSETERLGQRGGDNVSMIHYRDGA